MMVSVEELTKEHVMSASGSFRMEDQMEWIAGIGTDVTSGLLKWGWKNSRVAISDALQVLCIWGVEPDGYVWLAATTEAESAALSLHRILRQEIDHLHSVADTLYCWSDSRNTTHHRWLEWCGFRLVEEQPWGVLGLPFRHYRKECNVPITGHPSGGLGGIFSDGDGSPERGL